MFFRYLVVNSVTCENVFINNADLGKGFPWLHVLDMVPGKSSFFVLRKCIYKAIGERGDCLITRSGRGGATGVGGVIGLEPGSEKVMGETFDGAGESNRVRVLAEGVKAAV